MDRVWPLGDCTEKSSSPTCKMEEKDTLIPAAKIREDELHRYKTLTIFITNRTESDALTNETSLACTAAYITECYLHRSPFAHQALLYDCILCPWRTLARETALGTDPGEQREPRQRRMLPVLQALLETTAELCAAARVLCWGMSMSQCMSISAPSSKQHTKASVSNHSDKFK